eukprot:scaffold126625_cov21-Tisochrysis_lutea.AAC.1
MNTQASAAHPPTLLVGYDSEEDEDEEASGASGAALRAGSSPALVLSVAENGPQIGRAAVDLWTYAVRITPEDLAEGIARKALVGLAMPHLIMLNTTMACSTVTTPVLATFSAAW